MKRLLPFYCLFLIFLSGGQTISAQPAITAGLKVPRLTTEQRDRIQAVSNLYAKGQFIYNVDTDCPEYWDGNDWISLCQIELIPKMNESERDNIENPVNGLLIYNTEENCFNYYSVESDGTGSWNSLCGGLTKSVVTADCRDVVYHGVYTKGAPLNSSNYLTMTVNVVKAGAYGFIATTDNGYGFNSSGLFLNAGVQQVILAGQGNPINESTGDTVKVIINGSAANYTCTDAHVIIPVEPANPTFSMDCNSVTVNGIYSKGISLKPSNTITLTVNITVLGNGQWDVSTNTVDGVYFSGNGTFTSTGIQTITLNGYGNPTSAKVKMLTINNNSAGIAKTCTATVNCVYTVKNILVMGNSTAFGGPSNGTYGYDANARASYNMVKAAVNFGTNSNSTVQVSGLNMSGLGSTSTISLPATVSANPTDANLQTALANKPDIVIIGWGMGYSAAAIAEFTDYLNNGGVMIIMNKYSSTGNSNSTEAPFFSALFGTTVTAKTITNTSGTTLAGGSSVGSLFRLASIPGDPVLNGSFGNLNGLIWGNDYFPATYMSGIPEAQIITYSGANVIGSNTSTGVTMFRHINLNLFWIGDGGFLSNQYESGTYTSNNIEPFATDASHKPVPKNSFGSNVNNGGVNQTVYNSQLFANILAWAIQQAENNGINSK